MIENYLQILEESLQKKLGVLQQIAAENKNQETVLKEEPVSLEKFEEIVDQKAVLIEEIDRLDIGFERLYDRIKEQLLSGREQYREQIGRLQGLVSEITEASVSIQAQEARNKALVEKYFAENREKVRTDRVRAKSALDFYNRMSGPRGGAAPRFMDKKR